MIQRIQTIYLLLVTIACVVFIFIPFGLQLKPDETAEILIAKNYMSDMVGALLIAVLAFASIFLFTNRKLQMKVVLLNSLLSLLYMAFLAYGIFQHVGLSNYGFKIGAILPVFIFIFNVLAYAGIKSDENLVRSMDRLR
ncbi:MAG: DUF4293 domain-containing protein [Chitinophagales bacterium]